MTRRTLSLLYVVVFLIAVLSLRAQTVFAQTSPSFDGTWKGSGKSSSGVPFELRFTIKDNYLTGLVYQFPGNDGVECFAVENEHISSVQPQLADNKLSGTVGADFEIMATFANDETATGHLSAHWHARQPRCNGDYEVDWTATRQATATGSATPPQPLDAHPFQTFFQILIFGLSNGAVLALNAIGVTLIYSTVRTLNLAHGDVFALTTALVTSTVNAIGITQQWPPVQLMLALTLLLLTAIGAGALLSVGVEQLGFKPFRGYSRLAPLIATLGLSFILYQGALVWRTFQGSWIPGEHRSVPGSGVTEVPTDGIPNFLPEINLTQALGLHLNIIIRFADVFVVAMAILFVLLATWFLQKTRTGRAIRALSQHQQAAQIVGVNVNQTITRAFAVGGAFAGSAAFIFALYYGRPFGAHGAQSGLLAFAAALLGGIGSPIGALMSGLTMGVVSSLSDYYLSAQWTPVLLLTLLVLLLAWRPTGLASSDDALSAEELVVRDSVILTGATPSTNSRRWLLIFLIVLALMPPVMQLFNISGQTILRTIGVFILLSLGLNLALGLAGLLDFGFSASFGLGAYVAALMSKYDFTFVLLIAALFGVVLGILKGGLARRLRGDFFAVATLTLGLLARQVIINLHQWTGGAGGLGGFAAPHFLSLNLFSQSWKFYLVFGFVLLAAWLASRLTLSRTGRAWIASSEDEAAALAVGVDVTRYRIQALLLSSALAAIAGALFAGTFSYVDPEITMSFHISSLILTMVILGGAGNVTGAIVGAAVIILYDKVIVNKLADLVALIWPHGLNIGATGAPPDIRGAAFFNFGIALYLTVLLRARRRNSN
jgi:ABC-type branched-subunit amino acid transport system permease subunit